MSSSLKARLVDQADALSFDLCRIAAPDAIPDAPSRLRAFLEAGYAGDMDWLASTEPRRAAPHVLWPEVRSIVMLGQNYGPDRDPLETLADPAAGTISVYARGRDYHEVIKGKLKQLAGWLVAAARRDGLHDADVKVFVDTAPVMEKPLAAAAGLGWQGKHTNLVSRDFGSWLFLGAIYTTVPLAADPPEADHCGSCRRCLDACPTDAFPAPYTLDARRCISYLTIEHRGEIPEIFRPAMGNRIFGCDDCLAVCPWNKWAQSGRDLKLAARAALVGPRLADLLALDDEGFRSLFAGTPVRRVGHARFLRNVLIAAGNSRRRDLEGAVSRHVDSDDAVVRGTAQWALAALRTPAAVRR